VDNKCECKVGFEEVSESKKCFEKCKDSEYRDLSDNTCKGPCDTSCKKCIGPLPTDCSEC